MLSKAYNNSKIAALVWLLAVIFSCPLQNADAAAMNDYCITPPYIGSTLPNLLLMFDNSSSQYDLASFDTVTNTMFCYDNTYKNTQYCTMTQTVSCNTTTNTCSSQGGVGQTCSLASGSTTTGICSYPTVTSGTTPCTSDANCGSNTNQACLSQYAGYFDEDTYYISTNGVSYATDITAGNTTFSSFARDTGWPHAGCTYQAGIGGISANAYLCVITTGSPPTGVTTFAAKGSFLNWLSASKMDIQKKILTGGKLDTTVTPNVLVSEGRGCVGGRFVKEIPDADWIGSPSTRIVFGVRGDISTDARVPSTGGTTRIDIFYSNSTTGFDNATCQTAISCWAGGGGGTCKLGSDACAGITASGSGGGPRSTWEHSLQACWSCAHTPCCPEDILLNGDVNVITGTGECGSLTLAQAALLLPSDPLYVCLRDTNAAMTPDFSGSGCSMHDFSADTGGKSGAYIGACMDSSGAFPNDNASKKCVQYEFASYCRGLQVTDVIDPTNDTADTSGTGNVPGALIDAGITGQLGNPIETFHVRVVPADMNKLTGLVQKFKGNIRFGVMDFNTYGSASECDQPNTNIFYTCSAPGNKDGGSILANAYIGDPIGDHSSGLINAIDIIRATTWTPFSEAFYNAIGYFANKSSGSFPINSGDYDINKNPVQSPCQLNNVLIITDGQSTADLNSKVTNAVNANHHDSQYDTTVNTSCPATSPIKFAGSRNLNDLAWVAQNFSIAAFSTSPTFSVTATPTSKSDKISTYVVYSGTSTAATNECNPAVLMNDTATQGGTSLYSASNPQLLQNQIEAALAAISSKAAAGTAASVLASGEGSGANLIQAVFYPQRQFKNTATNAFDTVSWIGRLTNLWYYVDPFLGSSSIREDNGCATCTVTQPNPTPWNGNKILDLLASSTTTTGDYIINMFYDSTSGVTKAHRWTDPNGTGLVVSTNALPDIGFEDLGYLWEAGTLLWERNLTTSPRTIKTSLGNTPPAFIDFPTASLSTSPSISTYMNAGSLTSQLVTWVTGSDVNIGTGITNFRSRTVKIETIDQTPRVWKLGDVVNSTPRLMSWTALNNYGQRYGDTTYGTSGVLESADDPSHFVTTGDYKNRGVVFAGGNDGMLHAFKLGTLQLQWGQGKTQKARMVADRSSNTLCTAGTTTIAPTCGQEIWAFIPKSALPYLKYTADPNYCHINSVDLTPFIFDASIGGASDTADTTRTASMWRTVLIGGMRFGGACKRFTDACTSPGNCVKNPVNDVGYSSYFAIDITDPDPNNWSLLWEFSDPNLGFTTSGPAVIRINGSDQSKNGNWFVVFGSGPTGPISTSDHQFMGQSDQTLKLFVLPLKTGIAHTFSSTGKNYIETNIPEAFSGSLLGGPLDIDEDYQDEVLYVPYVKKDPSAGTWTKGGVLRLMTKKDPLPDNWQVSTLIDNNDIGPVTSAVVKINDRTANKLWAFFGEGRYYYLKSNSSDDPSPSVNRRLFGIKDTCLPQMKIANTSCSDTVAFSDLLNVDTPSATEDPQGWYLSLDPANATTGLNAEREITDPLATSGGVVYFTTYKPYTDLCTLGGKTFIWAVKYNTGGCVNTVNGKVLVQVSTGAIQQQDLSQIFGCNLPAPGSTGSPFAAGDDQKHGRRSPAMEGKPPEMQGLSVMSAPGGVDRTIHVRER